jgi:hypothetical protein
MYTLYPSPLRTVLITMIYSMQSLKHTKTITYIYTAYVYIYMYIYAVYIYIMCIYIYFKYVCIIYIYITTHDYTSPRYPNLYIYIYIYTIYTHNPPPFHGLKPSKMTTCIRCSWCFKSCTSLAQIAHQGFLGAQKLHHFMVI